MKVYKMIIDKFIFVVSVVLMVIVGALVGLILYELFIRNFLNKSFRATTELCGFMFMWMTFLGVIYLYDKDRLMRFEMIYSLAEGKKKLIYWITNKLVSLLLGVVMVLSYIEIYPIVNTTYYSTMQFLSKAWFYLPMALAGGFIVVKTMYQLIEKIIELNSDKKVVSK